MSTANGNFPWNASEIRRHADALIAAIEQQVPSCMVEHAKRLYRQHRRRVSLFEEQGLFEDPAFNIMLDLYIARSAGTLVSVSSACIASGVAETTALRWLTKLKDLGLIERDPDPFDSRRTYVRLTEDAVTKLERVLKDELA